ncbi:hypothetical protein CEXT_619311 [Caerostris extrusa]|uniref:Uncharacterized protein n=1 Tax=Caerostris extrusa TaxID=172846 RepID=A0AAV4MND4_CAEEX|nr:hypothetical protein CEXT_619311 [Caerostris extrusa]
MSHYATVIYQSPIWSDCLQANSSPRRSSYPPFFQFSITMSPSSCLTQKATISHPPPLITQALTAHRRHSRPRLVEIQVPSWVNGA